MTNFKDAMSKVANTVSIIAYCEGIKSKEFAAVTISSLVSISVKENEEEILFVLKKDSRAAMELRNGKRFTANVLSDLQSNLARIYGGATYDEQFNPKVIEEYLDMTGDFTIVKNAHLVFSAEISHIVERKYSNLYLGRISDFFASSDTQALIHYLRRYQAPNSQFL